MMEFPSLAKRPTWRPSSHALKKLAGRYDPRTGPCAGKVVHVPGYQVMSTGGLGAFKENIVVWIGAGMHFSRRLYPETILSNTAKRAVNLAATRLNFGRWSTSSYSAKISSLTQS